MDKLLIVCGPTASGKTSVALNLAKKFEGELISADSRQVYRGLDIGTGKDLPKDAQLQKNDNSRLPGYYLINGIKLWGYDLVSAKEQFSVSQYIKMANLVIKDILKRGKLPILVGGTGLYIKGVVEGIPTADIPQNQALRDNLIDKSRELLFEILATLDPVKAGSLNTSDKQNPRRLIRAIEIAQYKLENNILLQNKFINREYDKLFIGLTAPQEVVTQRIEKRVEQRIQMGLEEEIKTLLKKGVGWESQSMASLGYRQWEGYFKSEKSREEVVENWLSEEKKYAKRQMVWFKREQKINWFDICREDYLQSIENEVKKWYRSSR